jgi:hypothetical protein
MNFLILLQILAFAFALWFGLYLLNRDLGKPLLRFAGLGLTTYALGLALDSLSHYAPEMSRWAWPLALLPTIFWFGATLHLLPDSSSLRAHWTSRYDDALLFGAVVFYFAAVALNARQGALYWLFVGVAALPLGIALWLMWHRLRNKMQGGAGSIFFTAATFFGLGLGLMIAPLDWLPREIVLLSLSFDLFLLGYIIAALDAFNEGEALLPDFLRSFGFSAFAVLIFGGQVGLVVAFAGLNAALFALWLAVVATAIFTQVFSDGIQTALDKLVFARFPRLRQARAELRGAANALPRLNELVDPEAIDDAEFVRLTRSALSHMGDLPRLSANPLTRLPLIDARLNGHGGENTLERAAELKKLLTESIQRLKPQAKGDFGSSDEWRYYNALYFIYIIGLRPYSRREYDDLDEAAKAALDWFRTTVPERTLHNWQNAAAKLVAQDLRERLH